MRTLSIILLLTACLAELNGQTINPKYYLFGTLRDYSGGYFSYTSLSSKRFYIARNEKNVGERLRIEEVTSLKFKRMRARKNCLHCHETFKLRGVRTSWRLGAFYRYKVEYSQGTQPFLRWVGTLKAHKILDAKGDKQLSYLSGVFLSLDKVDSDTISLTFFNAPSKRNCVKTLLAQFGCAIIDETVREENIPVPYGLKFIATPEIRQLAENEVKKKHTFANTNHQNRDSK